MNNYVITDIHGNAERFEALLSLLNKKHPIGDFKLYILGDLFDRGDESEKVISLIMSDTEHIEVLKGNHEWLFMRFMQSPVMYYFDWQMNYSYATIMSFVDKEKDVLFEKYKDASDEQMAREFYAAYLNLNKKLEKKFAKYSGDHSCDAYVNQITKTVSTRDIRNVAKDYMYMLKSGEFKDKSAKYLIAFKDLTFLKIVDRFCDIYDYFTTLKTYELVGDNYLLLHSGFPSVNKDPAIEGVVPFDKYEYCEQVKDLPAQSEFPMLWERRKDIKTGKFVPPNTRFDDRVIVYGHTMAEYFNDEKRNHNSYFCYDKKGKLASIGIDGYNCERVYGQLNCLCLNDLSQIVVKGTTFAYLNSPNEVTITEVPYKGELPYQKGQE